MENLIQLTERILQIPIKASQHAKDVDTFIVYVHYLMAVLFLGWGAYFLFALLRFRKSVHPKADYHGVQSHASSWIEGAVALIEAVLLLGFAIPLWAKVVDQFPAEKDATVVHIAAQQFAWNIRYPGADGVFGKQDMKFVTGENQLGVDPKDPRAKDDIQTLNELHVPVNKPVIVQLTSKDVIHSFKIIAQRVCQDAIPGMSIPVWFKPIMEGKYQINCAQLCGIGHANMAQGFLFVESQDKFDKWLADKAKTAGSSATSFE
ncbi:MAG: hypothetical protein HY043_20630 [Verrucomicrobia bacterium]|nr:hypothetical protein [Verrucomicrobiota bacterium]